MILSLLRIHYSNYSLHLVWYFDVLEKQESRINSTAPHAESEIVGIDFLPSRIQHSSTQPRQNQKQQVVRIFPCHPLEHDFSLSTHSDESPEPRTHAHRHVITADVSTDGGEFDFLPIAVDARFRNHPPTFESDGMGYISEEFGLIRIRNPLSEMIATARAVGGDERILRVTFGTMILNPLVGHGDEKSILAVDDLEVTNYKALVNDDRAEGEQSFVRGLVFVHELDTDFGDFHGGASSPLALCGHYSVVCRS